MRDGWVEYKFKDVATAVKGKLPKNKNEDGIGIPYLTANFLRSSKPDYWIENIEGAVTAEDGDCLILWDGAGAGDLFSAHRGVVSSTMAVVTTQNSKIFREFLTLFISSKAEYIKETCRGTTVPHVSPDAIANMDLKIPPLSEQKRIVDLISSVDSYIKALQQQLDSAKRSRNAVLHELLTTGGDDWIERKLPELVEVLDRMRKPINSTEREERKGTIPYYGANGQTGWIDEFIFNEELVLLGEDAIDFADPSARKAYLIQGPSWVNNHAHVLRADKTIVNSYFLMESLNKVDYSHYVSFGTRSKLTQASMNGIKLLIPPIKIQENFVDFLENFDEVIEATQRSIEDSKVLRSGMLSDLLSGEHQIPTTYDKAMGAA
jgi:type I restriction enzyme S subunit